MTLGSHDIIAFTHTCDRERAKSFYRDTLGLNLISEDPFAMAFDAHGIMLRVASVKALTAAPYAVLGWKVPDIAAAVTELQRAGVAFEHYEGFGQDKLGIWTAPSSAKIAWFKDPDGTTLSLTEF
jgi:catechol 2,3-dioxygenase-like lactoylglutathione lyase family enzyme